MPQIKSNFIFRSSQPNFERDSYRTLQDLKNVKPSEIDEGHISYCEETKTHYIFRGDLPSNGLTGFFHELSFQDAIFVETKSELLNYPENKLKQMPVGKLVYCKEDNLMYYNCYPKWINNEIGYFNLLVDLQSSNYINKTDQEWIDVQATISDLKNSSLVSYLDVESMKNESDKNLSLMKRGQLAFCHETNHHYYLTDPKNVDNKKGYFGFYRTLRDQEEKFPIIQQPYIYIEPIYNQYYLENNWHIIEKDGKKIIVITESSTVPNIHAVQPEINRGLVNCEHFPYIKGDKKYNYIGDGDITTDMYVENNTLVFGDNDFYVSGKIQGNTPIPFDMDGIELPDLQWQNSKPIVSNNIIVNLTKDWKASTTKNGLTTQTPIPWGETMIGEAKLLPSCITQQSFAIPEGRTLKHIYIYSMFGNYIEEDLSNYRKTQNIYTYDTSKCGHRGEVQIKIEF